MREIAAPLCQSNQLSTCFWPLYLPTYLPTPLMTPSCAYYLCVRECVCVSMYSVVSCVRLWVVQSARVCARNAIGKLLAAITSTHSRC
eukprot:GHVU01110113.1.p1 GENE.GHVU01110113.1~~GHVU01110113.1.p1  ORF type:complete len:102 (-),score=1.51 GHVU01110113.1:147-410(-)